MNISILLMFLAREWFGSSPKNHSNEWKLLNWKDLLSFLYIIYSLDLQISKHQIKKTSFKFFKIIFFAIIIKVIYKSISVWKSNKFFLNFKFLIKFSTKILNFFYNFFIFNQYLMHHLRKYRTMLNFQQWRLPSVLN